VTPGVRIHTRLQGCGPVRKRRLDCTHAGACRHACAALRRRACAPGGSDPRVDSRRVAGETLEGLSKGYLRGISQKTLNGVLETH
jgi:hypothetical protein